MSVAKAPLVFQEEPIKIIVVELHSAKGQRLGRMLVSIYAASVSCTMLLLISLCRKMHLRQANSGMEHREFELGLLAVDKPLHIHTYTHTLTHIHSTYYWSGEPLYALLFQCNR